MMSANNRRCLGLLIILTATAAISLSPAGDDDYVIRFYLDNIDSVFSKFYLFDAVGSFSCKVNSVVEQTDYRGKLKSVDTAVYHVFITDGRIDSTATIDSVSRLPDDIQDDFRIFKPWRENYAFYFFPNDTGVGRLAIGFEPTADKSNILPTGLLNVNRDDYYIEELLLFYSDYKGNEQYSESIRFARTGPYLSLKDVTNRSVKVAFLGRKYTRQVLEFSDYRLLSR
jgi:hypothetical protein